MNDVKLSDFTVKQLAKMYVAVEGEMNFRMKADPDLYVKTDQEDFVLMLTQIANAMDIVKAKEMTVNN